MTIQELQAMTLNELLEVCNTDPEHIATAEQIGSWQIGKDIVFGSKEWFDAVPEIEF